MPEPIKSSPQYTNSQFIYNEQPKKQETGLRPTLDSRFSVPPAPEFAQDIEETRQQRLVLNRFNLYETKTNYYMIGSNQSDNRFRVLKIDRTSLTELNVIDHEAIYSKQEINDILSVLKEGNKYAGGLKRVLTADGIVGFIRFTEGYYISLVTKSSPVALIGGHYIYQIDETELLSISPQNKPEKNSDEQRYINTFKNVDLTKNFYFSYTYDITHTLQHNMIRTPNRSTFSYNEMFVWNHYLLDTGFRSLKNNSDWILPIIHGFVDQSKISIFGRNIFVTLIARRSRYFAGARFLKRGVNDQGYVANDVETEQIVSDMSTTSFHFSGTQLFDNPHYTSYVQHRGSIPLFWSQDATNMVPKPPIHMNFNDPFFVAAALHFDNMFKRYGAPIIVLNLIKKTKEKNKREAILGEEFVQCVDYLAQFLPEKSIVYKAWDMSKAKKSAEDVLGHLENFAEEFIADTGFFHSGPEPYINVLRREESEKKPQIRRKKLRQNGVVRTNCIDCLDRTNAAQMMIGKVALGHQLYALGVIKHPFVPVDSDVVDILNLMYHHHGDAIAFQYSGSNLVNTLAAYRHINHWQSHSRDIVENLRRYYSNTFTDNEKQEAINLFLGNFIPQKDRTALWALQNDYYLHNDDPRVRRSKRSYINWWTKDALIPREDNVFDETRYQLVPRLARQYDDEGDAYGGYWIEYYKPRLFTGFDDLFALKMESTTKFLPPKANTETYDFSPFTVRSTQAARILKTKQPDEKDNEREKQKKDKKVVSMMDGLVAKSLDPSVSSSEAKEYKRYINQFRNVTLASTPTGDDDPSLTIHTEYHHYANYTRLAESVDQTTDLRVSSVDEQLYETYTEMPKKAMMLQGVGAPGGHHYYSDTAKNRYQAYEIWLKTEMKMCVRRNLYRKFKSRHLVHIAHSQEK
ncbi:8999_t:CDS:10 [Ambispora leptoticha]|uniref:8999_t:CDS:1 n=1 Tax=Ambispora leptoticha TaxID=144679 RepID=A0A9N9AVE3_9GLOM|nr:8999_t:CDS:10 [Ambispora leptoticha]